MDDPVQPGQVLAKKYRVDRVLGIGGMGVVVAATHLELDQKVALKFMHAGVFVTEDARLRFQREARIASKLHSEHVARVTDTGTLENGAPYIVMEYLDGVDLSGQLSQYGPMPVGYAAECVVQACDAIGEAHANGIVHRDLKPANLFLTTRPDGSPLVKVLDFGISKASGGPEAGMAMTKTGALLGSPLYMSPEQMRSLKTVDARTDIWALGVILYELLTGRTPFISETFADLLLEVLTAQPPTLLQLRPDVPPEVSALVERCLTKDPAARVQSVAEIAEVLAPFCVASVGILAERITALARRSGTTGDPRVTTGNSRPNLTPSPVQTSPGPASLGAPHPAGIAAPPPGARTHAEFGATGSPEPSTRSAPWGWIGLGTAVALGAVAVVVTLPRVHGSFTGSLTSVEPSALSDAAPAAPPVAPFATGPATASPPSTGAPIAASPAPPTIATAQPLPPAPAVPPTPNTPGTHPLSRVAPPAPPTPALPATVHPAPPTPPRAPATTTAHPQSGMLDTSE